MELNGDRGLFWLKARGFYFCRPEGYLTERIGRGWVPWAKTGGALLSQPTRTVTETMRVCEIHAVLSRME
jgi:hypothetical protein